MQTNDPRKPCSSPLPDTDPSKRNDVRRRVAVIVAHPDDETLWAGGTILMHPEWRWTVVTLCRGSDPDRAPKFFRALERLGASGKMADLDDGPGQLPLEETVVRRTVLRLLGGEHFDLVLTHSPYGEYTRHRRHEETGRVVPALWEDGRLSADRLWMFAYEDGGGRCLPRPAVSAHCTVDLPDDVWRAKYAIVTEVYGFAEGSFEARTTPRREAFWTFRTPSAARAWVHAQGEKR